MALRGLFKKQKKDKAVTVVGLDGVPYSLVRRFAEDGTWPFMGRLIKEGSLSQMKVTLPEISAVSWPSFMTGSNPGVHGIFGFTEIDSEYKLRFPNFLDLKAPTFWDKLGEQGKRSVVINQPGTYPAREIPGVIISGFVAIELTKSVKPLRWLAALRRNNYEIDIDTNRCRRDHDQLFRELERTLEARSAIAELLWKEEEWDYFQVVITGTDRLQHYLFSAVSDESHPRHEQAMDYYRKLDRFIEEMWNRHHDTVSVSREGENFFMLSDHGFCLIKTEVFLNAWLKQHGFLKFNKEEPEGLSDISQDAVAFALDPGRIYIHRKGRYAKGKVEERDAERIAGEIKSGLEELLWEGEKVFDFVKTREEVYSGPETERGPDLIAVGNHGFDLKGRPEAKNLFDRSDLTGMHTWDDAFFWSAQKPDKEELCIDQLAEIITQPLK